MRVEIIGARVVVRWGGVGWGEGGGGRGWVGGWMVWGNREILLTSFPFVFACLLLLQLRQLLAGYAGLESKVSGCMKSKT